MNGYIKAQGGKDAISSMLARRKEAAVISNNNPLTSRK